MGPIHPSIECTCPLGQHQLPLLPSFSPHMDLQKHLRSRSSLRPKLVLCPLKQYLPPPPHDLPSQPHKLAQFCPSAHEFQVIWHPHGISSTKLKITKVIAGANMSVAPSVPTVQMSYTPCNLSGLHLSTLNPWVSSHHHSLGHYLCTCH